MSPVEPATATPDWERVRAQFPVTDELTYLDTASYGPGPRGVRDELRTALDDWSAGHGDWRVSERAGERARAGFARLLGADQGSIALLPAASIGVAQVAERVPVAPGANVVVAADEFRSNLFPWLNQARRGLEVRAVPFREGAPRVEDLVAALDGGTAVLAVSHVQSASGFRLDLAALARACGEHGTRLFVDATQSAGSVPIEPAGIDYLVVAGYKWLLAPRGTAYLYVAPAWQGELVPLAPGWKSPTDPYANYYGPPLEWADDASRCDVSLAWLPWVGAASALDFLLALGPAHVYARNAALAGAFRAGLPALGLRALFAEHESSAIVGLALPDPARVQAVLARAGVRAAVRGSYLRAAFHFFNDERDVERALAALRQALA